MITHHVYRIVEKRMFSYSSPCNCWTRNIPYLQQQQQHIAGFTLFSLWILLYVPRPLSSPEVCKLVLCCVIVARKETKKNKTHPVAANSRPGQEHTLSDVETRERISCLMLSGSVLSVILTISALPPFAALRSDSAPKCTTASSGLWNWAHILELTLCQRKTTILHGHGNRANSFR